MISISVCMIVKNEEKNLRDCLNCLKDIADEIVIVDTGSTDATKEIAAEFTDLIYDFTWTGSFSDARNFAFSKASKDYIYSADADERIDAKNQKLFLQLKRTLLPEIEIVQMYYCNQLKNNTIYSFDKEYRPKLYKRIRQFVWQEDIHEAVALTPVIYDSEISIIHMPEGDHAGRDLEAFARIAEKNGTLSKRLTGLYAKELFIAENVDDTHILQAGPFFIKAADEEAYADDIDMVKQICCVVARYYRTLTRLEASDTKGSTALIDFFKYALRVMSIEDGCSEMCYELGAFYEERGDYEEASMWYYNAVFETQPLLALQYQKDRSLHRLSACYYQLGNEELGLYYLNMIQKQEYV